MIHLQSALGQWLSNCLPEKRQTGLAVLGAAFFPTIGIGAFTFALSATAVSSGLSPAWIGLAFSGYFLARLVLAPFAGFAADRLGARPLLIGASGLGAVVPFLYAFSPAAEVLAVIQISLGFCAGIIKPASMGLLGQCAAQDNRGAVFGAYNTCFYLALVLAPLLGGASVHLQGADSAGIGPLTLSLPVIGMALAFFLFISIGRESSSVHGQGKERAKGGLPWSNPLFLSLLLAVLGRTIGSSVAITFLPRLISERFGMTGIVAGLLFALPNLVIILSMPVTSKWADSRDRAGLTFLGMGLCAACLFGYGVAPSSLVLGCLAVLMGVGSALSLPASMSLAADMGKSGAGVMGLFLGASNLGFVLGPGVAGFAAQKGGMTDAFELAALLGGFCLLPTFVIMSRRLHVNEKQ